jgi:hypothetical protein
MLREQGLTAGELRPSALPAWGSDALMSWWNFLTLLFGPSRRSATRQPRLEDRIGLALALIVILTLLVACQSPLRPMP